jgi:hypothetical protein
MKKTYRPNEKFRAVFDIASFLLSNVKKLG